MPNRHLLDGVPDRPSIEHYINIVKDKGFAAQFDLPSRGSHQSCLRRPCDRRASAHR